MKHTRMEAGLFMQEMPRILLRFMKLNRYVHGRRGK